MNDQQDALPVASNSQRKKKRKWLRWVSAIVIAIFLFVLLLIPETGRPRETSKRVKCANNLRHIDLALRMYAEDHHGEYPDSFGTLLLSEDIDSSVFNCPSTVDSPAEGPTTKALAENLNAGGHLSYVYLGNGMRLGAVPDKAVVAYEPLSNHPDAMIYMGAGMNVLIGDGHVEFVDAKIGQEIIDKAASTTRPVMFQLTQ